MKKINWGVIIGFFLGTISIITSFFPSSINITLTTFLLSIFSFFHDLYSKTRSSLERTQKHSTEMSIDVKNRLQVFRSEYSVSETFDKYVIERLDIIKSIKNTSFNVEDNQHIADEHFNQTKILTDAPKKIHPNIKIGLKWKDLGDKHAKKRFSQWSNIFKDTSGNAEGSYEYQIINNRVPYPNFLIITYYDDREEVLFNWDFRSGIYTPSILISNDKELVFFYNQQFDLLWKNSTKDSDELP